MYVRLAFAVAAHLEPEILIVDEVLAVGDAEFQDKCLGKMKDVSGQGRTVLFVSHNMPAVKTLCTRAILLDKGGVVVNNNVNTVIEKYLNFNVNAEDITHITYPVTDKHLQILEAKLIDKNKKVFAQAIDVFDEVSLNIKYRFARKIPKVHLTMIFVNASGEVVHFFDRRDHAFHFASVDEGIYESTIKFQNPLLRPGKYFLTLGCGDEDEGIDDHKFHVLSFTITGNTLARSERNGYLFLPLKWELEKIS
jgi:lipopolysaccharide transport system ATP-binding protein